MGSIVKLGSSPTVMSTTRNASEPIHSPPDVDKSLLENNRRATEAIWPQVVFFPGQVKSQVASSRA